MSGNLTAFTLFDKNFQKILEFLSHFGVKIDTIYREGKIADYISYGRSTRYGSGELILLYRMGDIRDMIWGKL